jgi:hypothetical protein
MMNLELKHFKDLYQTWRKGRAFSSFSYLYLPYLVFPSLDQVTKTNPSNECNNKQSCTCFEGLKVTKLNKQE